MDKDQLKYFKNKLLIEKKKVSGLINQLNKNGATQFNAETASELSFYDNHPADIADEVYQVELGKALEANEEVLLEKIDNALKSIKEGTYGKCKICGKDIDIERLKALPYAENCIECQDTISKVKSYNSQKRVTEESVIGEPFRHSFTHHTDDSVGFDLEDTYQALQRHNKIDDYEGYDYEEDDEVYVEEIEKISNQQYKNQLT